MILVEGDGRGGLVNCPSRRGQKITRWIESVSKVVPVVGVTDHNSKKEKTMRDLNKEMERRGIVAISNMQNSNGSYTCTVDLSKLTNESNVNFRDYKSKHMNEIKDGKKGGRTGGFLKEAVRNPILIYKSRMPLRSIDGRHTINMLQELEYALWTCDVHFNMSDDVAAKVFYELTMNSKRMEPWDAYHAAIDAKYGFALRLQEAMIEHEFKDDDFSGCDPLIEASIKNVIDEFLALLKSWKNLNKDEWKIAQLNPFQRGLIDFLTDDEIVKSPVALERLMNTSPSIIDAIAHTDCRRSDRNHFRDAFADVSRGLSFKAYRSRWNRNAA